MTTMSRMVPFWSNMMVMATLADVLTRTCHLDGWAVDSIIEQWMHIIYSS